MPVVTVRGPVPADQIGLTNSHEHLLLDLHRVSKNIAGILNDEALAIEEVGHFKAAGGSCIVEVTSLGLGRKPAALKRISEAADVHVVMGSSWYRDSHFPAEIQRRSLWDLADEVVRDLTEGVEGGIRAGIIGEVGDEGDYITPAEERVFRASALAQQRTGATITTHAFLHPVGVAQLDLLEHAGADVRRVVVGHCDSYLDLSYHEQILQRGAYVEYDLVGKGYIYPDARRADGIAELCRRGYADRLLLGTDVCLRTNLRAYGGYGYDYLITRFLPMLRERGVAEEQIQSMMVENPRRVLDW